MLEAFFGEIEGKDKVLPVPRPNSSVVTADEVSSEEISDDIEWLVRIEALPAREILPNLRKLENFGDFVGIWAVELLPSTVRCLASLFGKVADAVVKELVVG